MKKNKNKRSSRRKRLVNIKNLILPVLMTIILLLPLLLPKKASTTTFEITKVEYVEASKNTSTYIAHTQVEYVEVETVEAPTSSIEKAEKDISADTYSKESIFAKIDTSKITEDDINYFAKLVHAEFCGGGYEGRRAVANVVVNRIADGNLGNSIRSVIQRDGQFTPYRTGKLSTDYVCPECREAVIDVVYNDYRIFPIYVMYFQSISDDLFKGHETYMSIYSISGKSKMYFSSSKRDIKRYTES